MFLFCFLAVSMTENKDLINIARGLVKLTKVSNEVKFGEVGCALISGNDNLYVGVNIDAACGIGFCAEHSAIAAMVTNRERNIKKIVAVSSKNILPPCGRCREFMYQIDDKNWDTKIIIGENKVVKLRDLLPSPWQKRL